MSDQTILTWIAFAEIVVSLIGFGLSTAAYFILAPWYKSSVGRNFMFLLFALTFSLALTLVLSAAPMAAKWTLALTVYGMFAVSGILFAIAIVHQQLRNRHDLTQHEEPESDDDAGEKDE